MAKVAVHGAAGRMGRQVLSRVLEAPDLQLVAALDRVGSPHVGTDAGTLAGRSECGVKVTTELGDLGGADVVIDFSSPDAFVALLASCDAAVVSGTTGTGADGEAAVAAASARIPVLVAANFSVGVAVLTHLAARAAVLLPDAEIELVESHHHGKVDAPSGTALAVAGAMASARGDVLSDVAAHGRVGHAPRTSSREIGVHALRLGGVVGEHTVYLGLASERVTLGHVAEDRGVFAEGSLRAARWVVGRDPGRYAMSDVLGLGVGSVATGDGA